MIVLGPLMVLQYLYWRYHYRPERTTWHYLQAKLAGKAAIELSPTREFTCSPWRVIW